MRIIPLESLGTVDTQTLPRYAHYNARRDMLVSDEGVVITGIFKDNPKAFLDGEKVKIHTQWYHENYWTTHLIQTRERMVCVHSGTDGVFYSPEFTGCIDNTFTGHFVDLH